MRRERSDWGRTEGREKQTQWAREARSKENERGQRGRGPESHSDALGLV